MKKFSFLQAFLHAHWAVHVAQPATKLNESKQVVLKLVITLIHDPIHQRERSKQTSNTLFLFVNFKYSETLLFSISKHCSTYTFQSGTRLLGYFLCWTLNNRITSSKFVKLTTRDLEFTPNLFNSVLIIFQSRASLAKWYHTVFNLCLKNKTIDWNTLENRGWGLQVARE